LLDECKRQVLRGSNLVKNVKKFSELEKSERHLMKIDLEKYLNEAIKITQAYSNEKKIDISVESESNHQVKADELLIDVFENILLNAIHHNQNNHVEIMIRVSNIEENEKKMLQIEFIDNGPGIPDFKKELIFKRSNKKINSVSGTGLGLYLVYSIIQQYDAKIRVEDKIPDDHTKGSKFILTFPYC
ncbi:MAG: sensor histidine kinase, partial [Promethearchaeota archaeon]